MDDLQTMRNEIDDIDNLIVDLYERRMQIAEGVAAYKQAAGKPVQDKVREKEKIQKVMDHARSDFSKEAVQSLYGQIMAVTRMVQYRKLSGERMTFKIFDMKEPEIGKKTKVVYAGVPGAYAEAAMVRYFGTEIDGFNVENFKDAMEAVAKDEAEYAVLPIENSTAGSVSDVYDLLALYDHTISGETMIRVEHCLLGRLDAELSDVKTVYSHPQALMQCKHFLDEKREWQQVSLQNTAAAAKKVLEDNDKTKAAIASKQAAKNYNLKVLQGMLNDVKDNFTRFIIVSHHHTFTTKANKISMCFEIPDESGSLYTILGHFIFNGLNMSRIESRPIKGKPWQYRFFVDVSGNLNDPAVRHAVHGIQSETENFKILGNYVGVETGVEPVC